MLKRKGDSSRVEYIPLQDFINGEYKHGGEMCDPAISVCIKCIPFYSLLSDYYLLCLVCLVIEDNNTCVRLLVSL